MQMLFDSTVLGFFLIPAFNFVKYKKFFKCKNIICTIWWVYVATIKKQIVTCLLDLRVQLSEHSHWLELSAFYLTFIRISDQRYNNMIMYVKSSKSRERTKDDGCGNIVNLDSDQIYSRLIIINMHIKRQMLTYSFNLCIELGRKP